MPKGNADGRVLKQKFMPIIYITGSFMKQPLYGHVRSDKQNGDKGRDMRKRRSL
jgi:hypothetical protein